MGSVGDECDPYTGQCICKPGVAGLQCNSCDEGFYGLSYRGCIGMSSIYTWKFNNIFTQLFSKFRRLGCHQDFFQ